MQDKPRIGPKKRLRICKCKTNILTGSWNVRTSFRSGSASLLLKRMQVPCTTWVELVRNLMAHGDAREGKWRGNWRMEWVASTIRPPPKVMYPALLKLMRTPRLPAVNWTDAPTDLNGLVLFRERRNLVSARVPSRSARAIHFRKSRDDGRGKEYRSCQKHESQSLQDIIF